MHILRWKLDLKNDLEVFKSNKKGFNLTSAYLNDYRIDLISGFT